MPGSKLLQRIHEISQKANLETVAVALYDYETSLHFAFHGDRWFHAASTFKAGILLALLRAVQEGRMALNDHLQIRNRFISIVDGSPYRIEGSRDGDSAVHRALGGALPLRQLAELMITRSSNLATNLLLDFLTLDFVREAVKAADLRGIEIRRGVEDQLAHEQGLNNEATAEGLVRLFRRFAEPNDFLDESHREEGLRILRAQEFNSMLPARLPEGTTVAHKTGEISTHCHDAGIVYPVNRQPYVVAILSEHGPEVAKRNRAIADLSLAAYRYAAGGPSDDKPGAA